MALGRDDRSIIDAQGRALAGAQVYWCLQPASTTNNPPSPLATVYSDAAGADPITQPVLTDGFGHADAYMDDGVLYTVVVWHPLFGGDPIVYTDQALNGLGAGGGLTPFAGSLLGTIDGTNKVFTVTLDGTNPLTILPSQMTVWLNVPLIKGLGYTVALTGGQVQVTFAAAPQPASGGSAGDSLYAQGLYAA